MKEIIKDITRVEHYTVYQATDGTEFSDREECIKYEESARAVMRGRIMDFKVGEADDAWSLMGGCDNHSVVGFALPHSFHIETFLQWLYLECPWYLDDINRQRSEEVLQIVKEAQKAGDIILMGVNCDGDYYFINSRQNIINNLKNLDKENKNA